jgi:hypothetical protein
MTESKNPRRRSLLKGAAVAAGAMSAPMVAVAQTTAFRFQSTWPAKDIFHEFAHDFAKKVNDMAGSRLKIEVLPAARWCRPSSCSKRSTRARSTAATAWWRTTTARTRRWRCGARPGLRHGSEHGAVLAQLRRRQGLLEEIYKSINMEVVSYLYGPMPTQPSAGSRSRFATGGPE